MRPGWWVVLGLGAATVALWVGSLLTWRRRMVSRAVELIGTPYQWGGGHGGPGSWWGLDCSGLVIQCAATAGLDLRGWDAERMRLSLPVVESPRPGDLAVYSPRHVAIVEDVWLDGSVQIIHAANGGPSITSPEAAQAAGARVMRAAHAPDAHPGFAGYRSIDPTGPTGGE